MSNGKSFLGTTILIAMFLIQAGCGLIQQALNRPNTEKDEWIEWAECFDQKPWVYAGIEHSVFCLKGKKAKPPILLLHELNGLTDNTFRYAQELSEDFTVYLPMLFGHKGANSVVYGYYAYWLKGLFDFFPTGEWGNRNDESAPIIEWLRGVVQRVHSNHNSSPIRIIGNCMTGSLPLALLNKVNSGGPNVDAVVLAQPALPMFFWKWRTDRDMESLGLSKTDWNHALDSTGKILAFRFETDEISPRKTQQALLANFSTSTRLELVEICASSYQSGEKIIRPHSTLIGERDAKGEVGEISKRNRERVRSFLLEPTIISGRSSTCPLQPAED